MQGHQLGSTAGLAWRLGFAVGIAIGWAWKLPRVSVQAPWLCRARDYAQELGRACGLAPGLSGTVRWAPQLPRFSSQASCCGRTRGYGGAAVLLSGPGQPLDVQEKDSSRIKNP